MSLIRPFAVFMLYLLYLTIISAFILEIVFRFLPVSTSKFIQPVNDANPISHFRKNHLVVINEEPNFSNVRYKKTNNYGYFSDYDYKPNRTPNKCRSIVIGDSYVEAKQVDNKEAFHYLLNKKDCETFALAKSGDPFSQYLAYAEFAISEFNPDNLIFSIITNDYDESLLKYKAEPSSHYFNDNGELKRVDFEPSLLGLIVRSSSFIYYLYNDLKIHITLQEKLKQLINDGINHDVEHNKSLIKLERDTIWDSDVFLEKINQRLIERERDAIWATDIFIKKIAEIAKHRNVIIVVDGNRRGIYNGRENRDESTVLGRLNKYLIQKAKHHDNVVVIDMQNFFWEDWVINKKVFNSQYDYHWNAYGHFVVAKTIHCFSKATPCDYVQ
tara:strand:- start:93 stop:1247 length:1155 start_codon:yes stop_codon:yes gene_type:complete